MGITINTDIITHFLMLPPDEALLRMLLTVGWIPIAIGFLYGAFLIWIDYIQDRWGGKQKHIFLAIDVPKDNQLSLRAVENMFTYFGGAHGTNNLIEEYWEGKYQLGFSFELISIDGYIQFIVRTPEQFRNLTESAFYSQYPDAEITEINDYTEGFPSTYPDEEWDIWGVEFVPAKNHMLPIKTYEEFEHQMGEPETHFKDPMASLMDLYSSLRPGEQIWWQLIVVPTGFDWMEEGDKIISKILKEKPKRTGGVITAMSDGLFKILDEFADILRGLWGMPPGESSAKENEKEDALKMMNLKPKEKKQVEAIQRKASKLGFECKNRFVYVAKNEVMNKAKVVNGFVGFMKQFMDLDTNNLRPDLEVTGTRANYLFKQAIIRERKRKIMSAYRSRSGTIGRKRYILNIEELATLWHFPLEAVVKAPLIQKAPGRKSEAPMSLPVETGNEGRRAVFSPEDDIFRDENSSNSSEPQTNKIDENIFIETNKTSAEPEIKNKNQEDKKENNNTEDKGKPPANLPFA